VRLRKTGRHDTDVTWRGRSFQLRAAATENARSPTVDSRVRLTGSDVVGADRRRVIIPRSTGCKSPSARCVGSVLWIHLYLLFDYRPPKFFFIHSFTTFCSACEAIFVIIGHFNCFCYSLTESQHVTFAPSLSNFWKRPKTTGFSCSSSFLCSPCSAIRHF